MASRNKALTPRANSKTNMSSAANRSAKKPSASAPKPNGNILNFFKKVENPLKDESIFVPRGSKDVVPARPSPEIILDPDVEDLYADDDALDGARFNEVGGSVKRRKILSGDIAVEKMGDDGGDVGVDISAAVCPPLVEESTETKNPKSKKPKRRGPFLSDSDTEDEVGDVILPKFAVQARNKALDGPDKHEDLGTSSALSSVEPSGSDDQVTFKRHKRVPIAKAQAKWEALQPKKRAQPNIQVAVDDTADESTNTGNDVPIPSLNKEETSVDEWGKFDDIEDFPDDEYAEGEEFIERKWMEEQTRLEDEGVQEEEFNGFPDDDELGKGAPGERTATCPICDSDLGGITPDEATRHVNGCLDGNPIPLPGPKTSKSGSSEVKLLPPGSSSRFIRKAAIPRPGQASPFQIGNSDTTQSSAFSKLMSGHAEDAAWASAAAAEQSARGKPAYQRTCPFYKIIPGFSICVDAFRYGAVQGCNAYFLSHFHSDHYVGLTSSWCHGPIYCSKVTANLVKQQLRVDPKWVVALDFEARFEVPGTQGVAVTMIPANHCPGSSLFLFEKTVGRGANPKIQRVLHCGDFRACPAHIAHPLLMPDIVDSITGKTKQQKIDVCYLDTTYLNPKYSFPCQEDVVKACADMCVSLKSERAEENDAWEVAKRQRAGNMAKFVSKPEEPNPVSNPSKPRGRLLVVCGTYSIGKEKICMGIARALDCKIWAPPGKMRICAALEDPELMSRMTDDPREAQIHMQMLMEIRPETLQEYLQSYKPHFSRVVGFRPSGWNYRPPSSRFVPSCPPFFVNANYQIARSMQAPASPRSCTRPTGAPPSRSRTWYRSAAARSRPAALACPTRSTAASAS